MRGIWLALSSLSLVAVSATAHAQVAVERTRFELPSSNGYGAIIVHLDDADPSRARRATHFREHLFAAEEPVVDEQGDEVWAGSDFAAVYTRDLLYDAYFGVRHSDGQTWLPNVTADLDESGYVGWTDDARGGTGVVALVQQAGDLEVTSYYFAPFELEQSAFVVAVRVRNTGVTTVSDAQAFSLHNVHLGYGRPQSPWDVHQDIGENGETLQRIVDADGQAFVEQGFAGVVASRAVGDVGHFGTAPGVDVYAVVDATAGDLPDNPPLASAVDGAVGAWQFDLGDLAPGADAWAAIVVAHHGDPFAGTPTLAAIDDYIDGRTADALVAGEVALWADFQGGLSIPDGADPLEERVVRQSAAMLRMGQVREHEIYLREWLTQDGEARRTRFDGSVPGTIEHHGAGAVLASLPPGNWTYAWIRDGAYAIKAMATLGMEAEARDALSFYLQAEAGRFQEWKELQAYEMPEYQISLVRYYGFGVEETDFNDFGPNLEFDGFGLFLWALRSYERLTGDETLADDNWGVISAQVGDVLVDLVEPTTGLLRADSSIWETHWNGRERHWAYTNITAVRGLCDASEIAVRNGDDERAELYRDTAEQLRAAMAERLTDADGFIASNLEELDAGEGYYDAAVLDAVAMGLFDPAQAIATGTLAGLDAQLLVDASEVGWSRNDDRYDHSDAEDLSPWGSDYDSAEWVITDLRGAIATRLAGDAERSDAILQWVLAQSNANYLMVAETYEENSGTYKFNAPMLGFGAGAYTLALAARAGAELGPACGAYYEDEDGGTDDTGNTSAGATDDNGDATAETASGSSATATAPGDASASGSASISASVGETSDSDPGALCPDGDSECASTCSCTSDRAPSRGGWLLALFGLLLVRRRAYPAAAVLALAATLVGCGGNGTPSDSDGTTDGDMTTLPVTSASTSISTSGATASGPGTSSGSTGTSGDSETTGTSGMEVEVCPVAFHYEGPGASPRLVGEWQGFDLESATAMEREGDGWAATIDLAPGLLAYKIVYDDGGEPVWALDPGETRRKYIDGVENSAVLVHDCNLPGLEVASSSPARPSAGAGRFTASLRFVDGAAGTGPDPEAYAAVLRREDERRDLVGGELVIHPETGDVDIDVEDLDDGKYSVVVEAATRSGRISEPLRLVFWIEAEPFAWEDALIYMIMTDRYRDGDADNNPAPIGGADPRADFLGGDLWGIADAIDEGLLDQLGVRAIWLSPWQTNPDGPYLAADDIHQVTGYHGYWPISAREVDPRWGGADALRAVVAAAHAHGIRVLQDYVINHVHEDHEYVEEHPDWFRTGCVCGTPGCDWTAQALVCMFRDYMPDIDHTVPAANARFVDDAVWWLDEYDLDGLRVDAVKHVEEAATRNMAAAVREGFEAAGTRYFLMGETAMGWNDCADPCNDENYGTISRYVGPHGLDGQFDFVLYHGVSYRTFAYGDNGMLHADFWFAHGQTKWPEGAVMTPYIGSHDTARFVSIADYRGQDGSHDRGVPFNQWDFPAVAPTDAEPYRRLQIGMAWLLGLPGAPLLYYGDEYGQWGGVDPNNRLLWRPQGDLGPWELDTLAYVRALGSARQQIRALRRGSYVGLFATDDDLVFGRLVEPGDAAVVALTRVDAPRQVDASVVQLGLDPGTVLEDALGGPDVTVDADGEVRIDIPPSGAVILAPQE